jgi:hypothetical protein
MLSGRTSAGSGAIVSLKYAFSIYVQVPFTTIVSTSSAVEPLMPVGSSVVGMSLFPCEGLDCSFGFA